MIRKSEHFEQIDRYLDSELTQPELSELESQLAIDSDLADELNLHLDVEHAIEENDIISLRENLNKIVQYQSDTENINVFDSFSFGLSEEMSSWENLNRQINSDAIRNIEHSFPKIHLYQHKIAGKENIHQFYKEQLDSNPVGKEESFSAYEENLFSEVQNALEESDILEIRANLKQIAQSMPAHQYSAEQIDDYVFDRLDSELRAQFEEELAININLANDVQLIRDIDLAWAENDIMDLRASLKEIQKSEAQASMRIEEIEGYIYNQLSDEQLSSFEAELAENKDLQAEINLIRNIDLAINESDVMQLRSNIQNIAGQIAAEKQTERSFTGKFKARKVVYAAVAASLIIMLSISGLLSRQASQGELYQKFYTTYPTSGINRSAESMAANRTLSEGLQKFDNHDYNTAINLFRKVIENDQNNMAGHFYAGASLQETGKYLKAINEYQTVIIDKDNLFVEQANWYIGLCYLQTSDDKKAYSQFKKIAENKGFYQQKAQAILRKMKVSQN
jgi:hypothetical protein